MKVKTETLTGLALQWASAKLVSDEVEIRGFSGGGHWIVAIYHGLCSSRVLTWSPEDNPYQLVQLITNHVTELVKCGSHSDNHPQHIEWWEASVGCKGDKHFGYMKGTTVAEAVQRAYIAAFSGLEMDIPDELIPNQGEPSCQKTS